MMKMECTTMGVSLSVSITAAISWIGAIYSFWKSCQLRRTEKIGQLSREYNEKYLAVFLELVDRNERPFYGEGCLLQFESTEVEDKVDGLLHFLGHLLYLRGNGFLGKTEFSEFEYVMQSVVSSSQFINYLTDLDKYCTAKKLANPHRKVFEYMRKVQGL